jgi:chromosome segregation ATPase
VDSRSPDLPAYEDIIASLVARLEGLSAIHQGLSEAVESLVLAHYELDATKKQVEALTRATEAAVEDVQRLQPAELTATLRSGLDSLSRETSESVQALSQKLLAVSGEMTTAQTHSAERLGAIEEQISAQGEFLPRQFANLDQSLASQLIGAQTSVTDTLTTTRTTITELLQEVRSAVAEESQATNAAFASAADLQEKLSRDLSDIQQRQGDFTKRHKNLAQGLSDIQERQGNIVQRQVDLFPLVAELDRKLAALAQQGVALAGALATAQRVVDANQATAIEIQQISTTAGEEFKREIKRLKRNQWVSLVVILGAIVFACAQIIESLPTS